MDYVKSEIVIFDKATGAKVMLTPLSLKPTDPKQGWVALPADFSEATFTWNATSRVMAEDLAKVRAQLLASVKGEAEQRKMTFLSAGGAKKAEYAQKAAEVAFYDSLGGSVSTILTAINLLTAAQRQAKFGYSLADAAAFGEPTIVNAIERFRAGMAGSNKVPAIAAAEAKACAAIKAATTIAAARAAAVITWPS
jgi:hypothetical protein